MAGFRISTRNIKDNAARGAARRGANIRPALLRIGDAMRDSIREEFKLQGWRRPRGGLSRWLPVESFGTRPPPTRVLHRSGNLLRGWTQMTSQKVTGRTVQITNPLVYAKVHRGTDSSGRVAVTNKTEIKVTPKMRAFVWGKFGVNFWHTDKITIWARPHATANPQLIEVANDLVLQHIIGGGSL